MTREISNSDDVIDVRDVIARIEELEAYIEDPASLGEAIGHAVELKTLQSLMDDMKGCGGDEQWRGDWYPIILIRDSHFQDYAEELADDIGAINREATWPNNCIDWERAARELRQDYSSVEFNDITYWWHR